MTQSQFVLPYYFGSRRIPWTRVTLLFALALGVFGYFVNPFLPKLVTLVLAGSALCILTAFWGRKVLFCATGRQRAYRLSRTIAYDEEPKLIATGQGEISYRNAAAEDAGYPGTHMAQVLGCFIADAAEAMARLIGAARFEGHAQETLITRSGRCKVSVTYLTGDLFLWAIETIGVPGQATDEAAPMPMLTVGRNGAILFMNVAARALLGDRHSNLSDILVDEVPRFGDLNTLRTESGPLPCFLQSTKETRGRQEIYLMPASEAARGHVPLTFEDLPVAAMKLTADGEILLANRAARQLIKLSHYKGTYLSTLLEGLGRPLRDWLKETSEGRIEGTSEFLRLKSHQEEAYVQVTLGRAPGDEKGALFAVLNDATELKTLEAQFVQSQKMQAIGQLAGGVAHDFNNLLTAITGHCDLLLLRHDQGDEDFADLTQIGQNANRAASLVGQLLAFSRKQTLQPEIIDLREVLSDLSHLLNRLVGANLSLSVSHTQSLPSIRVDRQQFEQVIMNLVVNARDAMKEGGTISIETETRHLDQTLSRDRAKVPAGEYVLIKVVDQGVGIPEAHQQQVFEPFFTTKRTGEGTGLGLSTVYGIVKQSGGYVFIDSTLGEGTTFTLYFPALDASAAEAERAELALPIELATATTGTVLLVEDEAPVRSFAVRALEIKGMTVLEASSADEALAILAADEADIDLIVTDVIMPGLDGPTWVKQARRQHPDIPVIFVSGYAEEGFAEDRLNFENSTFLPKPFSLAQLTLTVDRELNRSRQ